MTRWVLVHLPHLLPPFVAFAFLIRLGIWAADQPPQHFTDEEVTAWRHERDALRAERRRPVSRRVSRLGLAALVLLLASFGTGLAIYTFNLRGDRPSELHVWLHSGASAAALAIVAVKVAGIGWPAIRAELSAARPQRAASSLVLLALGLPLLATGVVLQVRPDGESTLDYVHLITSVWWAILLQWHLWRYLGRAVAAAIRHAPPAPDAGPARTSPT